MKYVFSASAFVTAIGILLLLPQSSWAYVDPGSGFILLQVLIAVAIGGLFAFKRFWINLWHKLPFARTKRPPDKSD